MKLMQIRSATNKLTYGNKTFLVDPWLIEKHQFSFVDIPGMPFHALDPVKENLPMPFYNLPISIQEVLEGVDYYLITHVHPDHIDMAPDGTVGAYLDKEKTIICQNKADAEILTNSGFKEVIILTKDGLTIDNITLTKTDALHGTFRPCGDAMGVVFSAEGEKTLYLAGDTIWYDKVAETIKNYQPEVIMLNCCGAETKEHGRLIMHDEDIWAVAAMAPEARLYLTHMDNVAHASLTRQTLAGKLLQRGVAGWDMLKDGESISY